MTANEYGHCSDINCNGSCITVNILKIIELYILNIYCMACELYFHKAIVYLKKNKTPKNMKDSINNFLFIEKRYKNFSSLVHNNVNLNIYPC